MLDRTRLEWCLVTVFCVVIAAAATGLGWLWRMDLSAYDASMSLAAPAADPAVVIVAIDDPSLAEIGRWPWRRSVHAALIERLEQAGARVIAFDVILHEPNPDEPAADHALADAIAASGRVILPVVQASRGGRIVGEAPPAPLFQAGAAALGHIHVEFDPDGIARSVYLWEGFGRAQHPQLGLAALQMADPQRAAAYPPPPVTEEHEQWARADWLRIPFTGPPGTYPSVSYADVLRGDVDDAVFRDRVVFVGATALGLADSVPTPTSGFHRPMPGVEVNASVFAALDRGDAIRIISPGWSAVLAGALVFALMVVMLRTTPRAALVAAFVGATGALVAAWLGLQMGHVWFPPAGAVLGCLLCYPFWSWRRLEAAQRHLDMQLEQLHLGAATLLPSVPAAPAALPEPDPVNRRIALVDRAIAQQRALRRFVSDTLESLPVGAVVTDPAGRVLLCNQAALALLRVAQVEQLPAALGQLEWPPGLAMEGELPALGADGHGAVAEVDGPGDTRLMIRVAALRDPDGDHMIGRVFGLSDITRIRDAHRSREETMHYLSHDLRSPIASILTLIEAEKLTGKASPEQLQFLRQLGRYANAALKLADDLFRLVRADAIDQGRFVEFNLVGAIQDAIDEAWVLARGKSVRVGFEPAAGDVEVAQVVGDQELVRRAILNLLTNGIKYGPANGEVTVALTRVADDWVVSVTDQGEGIHPAQVPELFRHFGRLQNAASRREKGVGLGLMIVKTVAERHGGSVGVEAAVGRGARFLFRLPAIAPDAR